MKKYIYLCLLFVSFVNAQTLELIANIKYTNNSQKEVKNVVHKLTIPENRYYQEVKDIYISPKSDYKIKKRKKMDSKYLSIDFGDIKKGESKVKKVHFVIERKNLDINFFKEISRTNEFENKFLSKSKYLEIDSKPIQAISYLIEQNNIEIENKVKLAFEFPAKYLDYTIQNKTTALTALKSGIGDCTEYAMVFISLARNLGIEARRAAVFNFAKRDTFKVPNHHIAEIYTKKYGWVPVYPNLSLGGKKQKYQLGKIASNILLYKHRTWVWSRDFDDKSDKKFSKLINTKVNWELKNR